MNKTPPTNQIIIDRLKARVKERELLKERGGEAHATTPRLTAEAHTEAFMRKHERKVRVINMNDFEDKSFLSALADFAKGLDDE